MLKKTKQNNDATMLEFVIICYYFIIIKIVIILLLEFETLFYPVIFSNVVVLFSLKEIDYPKWSNFSIMLYYA